MSLSYSNKGHPYGVKPLGNALFAPAELRNSRMRSLGMFARLNEQNLLDILFYCSSLDLVSLSVSSKMLYVYCHHGDLWRDLCLLRWGGDFYYVNTWKDTFSYKCYQLKVQNIGAESPNGLTCPPKFIEHTPLVVPFAFSDLLHQSFLCRSFDIEHSCKHFMG